jgi:Zn-dependent peptidase ImmA (M78 family)
MKTNRTTTKKTALDWRLERSHLEQVGEQAEAIVRVQQVSSPPVDPFTIAASERRSLKLIVDDFRDRFDGKLEYSREIRRFLCFLNSKYDRRLEEGQHHPRTRFSLSHELGHFFLEHHAAYLMGGGKPHGSRSEFQRGGLVEREADAFAAAMLMPRYLFQKELNAEEPCLAHIEALAKTFGTSDVSTLFRAVQLSDFPCAVAAIRDGKLGWTFPSEPLIEAGIYPGEAGPLRSDGAKQAWARFEGGNFDRASADSIVGRWFRTYDRDRLDSTYVCEEFAPAPWANAVYVLLAISEAELMEAQGDEEDDEDNEEDD